MSTGRTSPFQTIGEHGGATYLPARTYAHFDEQNRCPLTFDSEPEPCYVSLHARILVGGSTPNIGMILITRAILDLRKNSCRNDCAPNHVATSSGRSGMIRCVPWTWLVECRLSDPKWFGLPSWPMEAYLKWATAETKPPSPHSPSPHKRPAHYGSYTHTLCGHRGTHSP